MEFVKKRRSLGRKSDAALFIWPGLSFDIFIVEKSASNIFEITK